VGAFSGVENAKKSGPSPEMPKAGSPLAKGELGAFWLYGEIPVVLVFLYKHLWP
jgi:hypothetical protein